MISQSIAQVPDDFSELTAAFVLFLDDSNIERATTVRGDNPLPECIRRLSRRVQLHATVLEAHLEVSQGSQHCLAFDFGSSHSTIVSGQFLIRKGAVTVRRD